MNPRSSKLKRFYMLLHSGGSAPSMFFTYYENDSVTGNITTLLCIGSEETVTVPTSIDDKAVDSIGIYTFMENTNLTSVEVQSNIQSID